jgi:WD40 repeat protein
MGPARSASAGIKATFIPLRQSRNFYALTAGDKGTLRLWDITSGWGGPVYTFPQSAVDLKTVSVSANGRYALIGDGDGMLHLWELEWKIAEREQADWDDSALPYLRKFLILHRPVKKNDPLERKGKLNGRSRILRS